MRTGACRFALALFGLAALSGPADAAGCNLARVAEIPVEISGLRALVPAKINSHSAKLAVDTGAFFSTLGPVSAASFGLKPSPLPPGLSIRGLTGEVQAHYGVAKDFTLYNLPFHNMGFLIGEHSFGDGVDGVVGQNVLAGVDDVEYDLGAGVIRLFDEKGCGEAPLAYWAPQGPYGVLAIDPIRLQNSQAGPIQTQIRGLATLNGTRIRVTFDSGAPSSTLTLRAARRAGVRTDGADVTAADMEQGVGRGVTQSWIAPFSSFDIGGEQVRSTRLRVADLDLGEGDMLLGADFFLSHRMLVSETHHKLYFTYNGGPVFDFSAPVPGVAGQPSSAPAASTTVAVAETAPPAPSAPGATQAPPTSAPTSTSSPTQTPSGPGVAPTDAQPTDAAGFTRRGLALAARHQYDEAEADFAHAIELEPNNAQFFVNRAVARLLNRQPFLAMDDLNQALKLKPDLVNALMLRGEVKLGAKDRAGANADFAAAQKADPGVQLRIANAYLRAGAFDEALAGFDGWISSHPKGEDLATPLWGRCRARAFLGRDLDKALTDCNESLSLTPGTPDALDSRGLVEFRLGQLDKAIADYTSVINVQPRNAWSLYGRGLARLKKGDAAGGNADLAAAMSIQPTLPQQARNVGLSS